MFVRVMMFWRGDVYVRVEEGLHVSHSWGLGTTISSFVRGLCALASIQHSAMRVFLCEQAVQSSQRRRVSVNVGEQEMVRVHQVQLQASALRGIVKMGVRVHSVQMEAFSLRV
uniref:Uncharacterized protein n=1 Tax=Setaria digitata TaxID=48799 RepID=A0A915Q0H9_9BILA